MAELTWKKNHENEYEKEFCQINVEEKNLLTWRKFEIKEEKKNEEGRSELKI